MLLSISLFIVSGYGTGEGLEKQWRSGETGFWIQQVGRCGIMGSGLLRWVCLVKPKGQTFCHKHSVGDLWVSLH